MRSERSKYLVGIVIGMLIGGIIVGYYDNRTRLPAEYQEGVDDGEYAIRSQLIPENQALAYELHYRKCEIEYLKNGTTVCPYFFWGGSV